MQPQQSPSKFVATHLTDVLYIRADRLMKQQSPAMTLLWIVRLATVRPGVDNQRQCTSRPITAQGGMALTLGDVDEYVTLLALLRFGIPIAFYFSQVAAVPHLLVCSNSNCRYFETIK